MLRLARSLALCLIAAAMLLAAPQDAAAAPGAGLAGLRTAVVALIDSIGVPATKADKKILSQLQKALALIDGNPATLADEIGLALKATSALPPSVLTTPGVDTAIDAALARYLTDVDAALDSVDAAVAALGAPGGVPAVAKSIAAARARVAAAQSPAATDLARIADLKAAMKKHGAATKALDKFIGTLPGACGNPKQQSPVLPADARVTVLPAAPITLTQGNGSQGTGTETNGAFGGTAADGGSTFFFATPNIPLAPGTHDIATWSGFAQVRYIDAGVTYVMTSGTFEILTISVRRYRTPGNFNGYLRVTGRFTGAGTVQFDPLQPISISAAFTFCEIPYGIAK